MLRYKPDSIPALIDPDIRLITNDIFLTDLCLSPLQTECLLLPSTATTCTCDLLLYPPDERLHEQREVVHGEVVVVRVDELSEEVEVGLQVHRQVVLSEHFDERVEIQLDLLGKDFLPNLGGKGVQGW